MKVESFMPILTTTSLSIGYSPKRPLHKNLNVSLFSGTLTALTGNNGTGKSTLLKTFIKIIKPLSGEVLFEEKNINQIPQKEFSKLVSVVLTDKLSSENFSAFEIISFGRSPYTGFFGRLSDEDLSIIKGVAKDLKIEALLDKKFYELSDGQKQKILIAKALAQEAKIIILDEPTAFLDFNAKDEIFALLKSIAEEKNIAVLVSTHDIFSMVKYADYLWLMSETELKTGTTKEMLEKEKYFRGIF
ncbi:MAG: ABC transporter ATP-binding protein [Bacteroidales bacterium]|nr:ABC transporter ATP-binding protein [Bacteroidales bacterium]